MKLRPYQGEAIEALFAWWGERKGENPLLVLPTGAGKTFTTVALLRRLVADFLGVRILILAHRRELLLQFEKSILAVWPMAPVGIFCAGLGRKELMPITIASRDSVGRNPQQLGRFDICVVDEAHNIDTRKAETRYRKIIADLKALNNQMTIVGLTATPFRDGSGYIYGDGQLFSGVAYEIRLKWLIEQGYLVKPVSKQVAAQIDTSGLRTILGDFNRKQLDERATHLETVRACLDEWQRVALAQGRTSTLFFAVSIRHAMMISAELAERGIDCRVVTGDTPQRDREEILEDFGARRIPALVNVGVMTEGTDIPVIDCVALMRPTRSLKLFIQMVGRGLRLSPGKKDCLLLDFGGCLQRFGPVDIAEPETRRKGPDRTKECPECDSIVGYFKRRCPDCDFEFMPPLLKVCPECGEENAPGARNCTACGYEWPLELEDTASTDAAFSDDVTPDIQAFDVDRILVSAKVSKSDRAYLRITYVCDILNQFHKNIMVGYDGYAGRKAETELRGLMGPFASHGVPESVGEAVALHRDGWLLQPVARVHVDMNAFYRNASGRRVKKPEVVNVEFQSEVAA